MGTGLCAQESQVKPHNNMGTAAHRQHGTDAFTAAAARVQHQHAAGRWGQQMSSRMSRSLAEGDASAAGESPLPVLYLLPADLTCSERMSTDRRQQARDLQASPLPAHS